MLNKKSPLCDSTQKLYAYKRDVLILLGVIGVTITLTLWPHSARSSQDYFPSLGLSLAVLTALFIGIAIYLHKICRMVEKSLKDLQLAGEEYQEEIEERKWAEGMLHESRIYSESIVESIAEPLLVLDANLKVIKANRSFYETFKVRPEEALQTGFGELDGGQWNVPELIEQLGRIIPDGEQIKDYELTREFGQIGKRTIFLNARRIYGKESVTNLILITMQDITEQRKAKEEVALRAEELARSNTELEHFAYIASHDLQEPLRMVSSYCQLLRQRYTDKLDADAHEFIDFAVSGAKQMQALINDLLAYSRVGTQKKPAVVVDCNEVFDNVVKNLSMAIRECQAVVKSEQLPVTVVDNTQIMQVFQNLICNALKFRGSQTPEVSVRAETTPDEWIFSVRDNGIGLDPEFAERIFVIFQRLHTKTEYSGTGIGLAICKKIIEGHGGRIWVESEPDKGSTFYFTLPKNRGTVQHV